MADFNALTALINAYIKQNGVKAITGQILNGVLRGMVSALGKGYTVAGEASPTTDPGTMTGPVAYIAHTAGTYEHFGNLVVAQGEVAMLIYDEAVWRKDVLLSLSANATVDANVGTPEVTCTFVDGVLTFDFRNMKGNPGVDGDPAGFGAVTATVDANVGTPGVTVQTSGPDTAKNIAFQFTNLKGETGVTSCVVTVDNTTGTPSCAVSLVGQELHLDFSGLKGAQGNTGSSIDYPFTIVNNLTTNDATQALSAAMGVQLESEVSQLEAEIAKISLYTGNPANGETLFKVSDLYGATRVYYNFDVPSGQASYIELMNASNQRISYIGRGSSSSGALHYDGYFDVPSGFSYAKFTTTSPTAGQTTIRKMAVQPSSYYYSLFDPEMLLALQDSVNPIILYSGKPLREDKLFTYKELEGADKFYYDFDVPSGQSSYIELMNAQDQRISYIGKGASNYGALHYEGFADIPSGFSYARFFTGTTTPRLTTINQLSVFPSSKLVKDFEFSAYKDIAIKPRVAKYVYHNVISDISGGEGYVDYAFSVRYLQMRAGDTLVALANGYQFTAIKYDRYGDFVGSIASNAFNILSVKVDEDCYLAINVVATDSTITFNNDFITKSGLKLYSDFEDKEKPNSAQLINRVYIPASQHGEDKVVRIPAIKIMPNRKSLAVYEVRDTLSDYSTSFLGYSIINNGILESYGSIGPKDSGEIRQFNPQIYTLANGDILCLWTSNGENDVCTMHYSVSSDYGVTWSAPGVVSGTISGNENILTAPANGVWVGAKIMLPVYITEGVYDEGSVRSGLMLLDPANMSHTEKFVSATIGLNECNVFVDGDVAFLSARQEAVTGLPTPYRRIYVIDTDLSGSFVEKTEFYYLSKYRPICQESYFKDDTTGLLYIGMANSGRVGLSLYVSQDLSRSYTKIVQPVDVLCGGYSCIDMTSNSMVFCTEGADPKNETGKYLFVDSVILSR